MRAIIIAVTLFIIGQSLVWFQTNSQFIWEFAKRNPMIMSLLGFPISYIFIKATAFAHTYFGELWPIRMLAFSSGILMFTLWTWYLAGEAVNWKTFTCIGLAFIIIFIQLLPKG